MERLRFNFLKWVLVLGMLIVLNLFIERTVNLAYPEPQWEDFCPREQVTIQPNTQEECVAKGGAWAQSNPKSMRPLPHIESLPDDMIGYCDLSYVCGKQYNSAHDLYERTMFIARIVLGVGALLVGFWTTQYEAVSLGFSFGGVLSLLIATVHYWSKLSQYFQVIVLGLALAVLVWLGMKKIKSS